MAVLTPDPKTQDLLTYGRLVVREAQRHGGPGWQEYDKIFRQHAALDSTIKWNELNPSHHASTVMTYRSGTSQCCTLCRGPNHDAGNCALLGLQLQPPALPPARTGSPMLGGPMRRAARPETLERICVSWNRGRCSFPACLFCHVCVTCRRRGHRARECVETPTDSPYKSSPPSAPKARGQGSSGPPATST